MEHVNSAEWQGGYFRRAEKSVLCIRKRRRISTQRRRRGDEQSDGAVITEGCSTVRKCCDGEDHGMEDNHGWGGWGKRRGGEWGGGGQFSPECIHIMGVRLPH